MSTLRCFSAMRLQFSLELRVSILLGNEGAIGLNESRTYRDCEEGYQNEQNEGRNHLDGGLGGPLFGPLSARGTQRIRVDPQSLRDAGAEAIGLDQSAHQRTKIIHAGAVDEIAQSFSPGLAGAHLKVHEMKFVAEVGMGVMQVLANTQ